MQRSPVMEDFAFEGPFWQQGALYLPIDKVLYFKIIEQLC